LKKKKFEAALERLEDIIHALENKELALDDALTLFQEGVDLYKQCHQKLEEAEGKISMILEENGQIKQVPFTERED